MAGYLTVADAGSAEIVIEKSKFIAQVREADSRDAAESFFAEIRGRHYDARHNVPVLVIGDKMQLQWASDDGEPQGTAGAPILQLLVGEGLTNVAVMVTRYFGGIKLGTGGLARAYTQVARTALSDAGRAEYRDAVRLQIVTEYSYLERLKFLCEQSGYCLADIEYKERVTAALSADAAREQEMIAALAGLTNGSAEIRGFTQERIRVPIGT